MNTPQNDGGPAFPQDAYLLDPNSTHDDIKASKGMTLRDWFAGQALQGLLASGHFTHKPYGKDGAWMVTHEDPYDEENGEKIHYGRQKFDFPEAAWRCADAMLKERNERQEP